MSGLRRTALQLGFETGLFGLARLAGRRRRAVILMLHRFSGAGEGHPRGMSIHKLDTFMAYLSRRYQVVSLSQLVGQLRCGAVQPYTAAVTIDDGYHEFSTLAAPILRRHRIPATVFVVSEFIEGRLWLWPDQFDFVFDRAGHDRVAFEHRGVVHVLDLQRGDVRESAREYWRNHAKHLRADERQELLGAIARAAHVQIPTAPPREYRPMTWSQLSTLVADGFDVGAHTCTHPILSRVDPELLGSEVADCKRQIEDRLGCRVRHFAYPNGCREDYTQETVAAVARAGYEAAVTAVEASNTPSTPLLELRRLSSGPEDLPRFAERVSGFQELKQCGFRLGFARAATGENPWRQLTE